jgi:transcriptional regulator
LSNDNNTERERKVLELYNQGKTSREIAKEQRLSLRDIGHILKKNRVNHGIAMIDDDNKKSPNEKSTQAYKLFSEGKSLIEVSIELGLREKEASKLFREFLKLKRQDRLHQIYPEIEPSLPSFLKLHKVLKKRGLNPANVEWFADAIEMGTIKLPELQGQYQSLQNRVLRMEHQK